MSSFPVKAKNTQKVVDFHSFLKGNGVLKTKGALSHVPSKLSHPLDLLFDPLYKYAANDNAFINIQKMMLRKWMERD